MKYSDKNPPLQCMMTQSTCYKGTRQMEILGILWHSTGANNPTLKRYVQPDDNAPDRDALLKLIGKNRYKNDWNHITREAGLNCWIGQLADGTVATVQTMPWDFRPWGCGSGKNGSCNNGWIQFEICEDNLNDEKYFNQIYEEAAQITAYLCKKFNIDPNGTVQVNGVFVPTILCHQDSYRYGMGNNHGDVYHWFSKFQKSMVKARQRVTEILQEDKQKSKTVAAPSASATQANGIIEVGDLVKIKAGAKYYSGAKIPSWVSSQNWYVYSIKNDRAVIHFNESRTSSIMSPINVKDLEEVGYQKPFEPYKVKVIDDALNYRSGPGMNNSVKGVIRDHGIYTIVAEAPDDRGLMWGKLKSGAGWIGLKYTQRI